MLYLQDLNEKMNVFARKEHTVDVKPKSLTKGCIEFVDVEKNFGFIKSNAGRKSNIYFHISNVVNSLSHGILF